MQIKLSSSDGIIFEAELRAIKLSATICDMLEIYGIENSAKNIIPLPSLHSKILSKVLQWCHNHQYDKVLTDAQRTAQDLVPPIGQSTLITLGEEKFKRRDNISQWDDAFFGEDHELMVEMLHAANYLGIPGLLNTAIKVLSNFMEDKTPIDIQSTLNIERDIDAQMTQSIFENYATLFARNRHCDHPIHDFLPTYSHY